MKIFVLGSGSKGNSTLVDFGNKKILLDVGFSYKHLKEKLESVGYTPKEIDYIFISHDHSDHIKGLEVFLNHNNPTVYISKKIIDLIPFIDNYPLTKELVDDLDFEDFIVNIIPTSHDATDSKGFLVTEKSTKETLVYLTDTGYINSRNFNYLKNKNYYIFESNHDVEKLVKGRYPEHLRRRILSSVGHLSNEDASVYLSKFIGSKTKKIALAHLSEENNTESLALETFKKVMKENDIAFDNVVCAKQEKVVVLND